MPRFSLLAALAVAGSACTGSSDVTEPVPPPSPPTSPAPTGQVTARVTVSGDPALGPGVYGIQLNGVLEGNALANEDIRIVVREGGYRVGLVPLSTVFSPSWCTTVGAIVQDVVVLRGKTVAVEFTVDCPLLAGEGEVVLQVTTTGTNLPTGFPITLTRGNGPPYSVTYGVPVNATWRGNVPVGAYRARIDLTGSCSRAYSETVFDLPSMVRAGTATTFRFTITCH